MHPRRERGSSKRASERASEQASKRASKRGRPLCVKCAEIAGRATYLQDHAQPCGPLHRRVRAYLRSCWARNARGRENSRGNPLACGRALRMTKCTVVLRRRRCNALTGRRTAVWMSKLHRDSAVAAERGLSTANSSVRTRQICRRRHTKIVALLVRATSSYSGITLEFRSTRCRTEGRRLGRVGSPRCSSG